MATFLVGDSVMLNKSLKNVQNQILQDLSYRNVGDADILQRMSTAVVVIMEKNTKSKPKYLN